MLIKSSLPSPPVNIGYKSCGKINEGDFRFWVIPETSPQYCLVVSVLNSHAPMLVSGDFVEAGPQNPSSTKPPETSQDGWKKKWKKLKDVKECYEMLSSVYNIVIVPMNTYSCGDLDKTYTRSSQPKCQLDGGCCQGAIPKWVTGHC